MKHPENLILARCLVDPRRLLAMAMGVVLCATPGHGATRLEVIANQGMKEQETIPSVVIIESRSNHFEAACTDSSVLRSLPGKVKIDDKGDGACIYNFKRAMIAMDASRAWSAMPIGNSVVFTDGTSSRRFSISRLEIQRIVFRDQSPHSDRSLSPFAKGAILFVAVHLIAFALYAYILSGTGAFAL